MCSDCLSCVWHMTGISCFPQLQVGRNTNYWYTSFFIIIIIIIIIIVIVVVLHLTSVKIQINDKTSYKSHTDSMLLSCHVCIPE